MYGRILFPVHVVINAESDLAAAPLLSVFFHEFFVFLFFHFCFSAEMEICRIPISRYRLTSVLAQCRIYFPICITYTERDVRVLEQSTGQFQRRILLSLMA